MKASFEIVGNEREADVGFEKTASVCEAGEAAIESSHRVGTFKEIFDLFEDTSPVKMRPNVKTVAFLTLSVTETGLIELRSRLCQNAYQEMKEVLYKHRL